MCKWCYLGTGKMTFKLNDSLLSSYSELDELSGLLIFELLTKAWSELGAFLF
jgi:hypothetical protein